MIQTVITATRRPEILARTLGSFKRFMPELFQSRALVNIDPVGGGPVEADQCVALVQNSFKSSAIMLPGQAGFPAAFRLLWLNSTARYLFHLEDDWELLRPVDLSAMIRVMEEQPDLAVLRLPWRPAGKADMKNWKVIFPWNGEFFECPAEARRQVGFCGHPSLVRGDFARSSAELLMADRNPEKQFHHGPAPLLELVESVRFGVWGPPEEGPAVRDIGRAWMVENGWRKAGNKAHFVAWEKI